MLDARISSSFSSRKPRLASFTLIEMLVTCALLVIVLGIILQLTTQVNKVWSSSNSRIQTFQEARGGYEAMTRRIGQSTLNTYYDYYENSGGSYFLRTTNNAATFVPSTYDRVSDLHFISGQATSLLGATSPKISTQTHAVFFQAPLGYSVAYQKLDDALNACGYFLEFDDASSFIPTYIKNSPGYKARYRFRLMEMLQPTENLGVYDGAENDWFVTNAASNSRILAENVIALVLQPKLQPSEDPTSAALAPAYNYNSRIPLGATSDTNWSSASPMFPPDSFTTTTVTGSTVTLTRHNQLPPLMHVVMIVIDEASAIRLQGNSTSVPSAINLTGTPLFTDATKLTNDIQSVEDICNAKAGNLTGNTLPLNYRIFSSDVIMRDAKWSNH
jgi:uncharacterized protein (TIGR02599 family)